MDAPLGKGRGWGSDARAGGGMGVPGEVRMNGKADGDRSRLRGMREREGQGSEGGDASGGGRAGAGSAEKKGM